MAAKPIAIGLDATQRPARVGIRTGDTALRCHPYTERSALRASALAISVDRAIPLSARSASHRRDTAGAVSRGHTPAISRMQLGDAMETERKYIVDESNRKVAVQVDIATFTKIEETIENYGLIQLMQAQEPDNGLLDLEQARSYYQMLEKTQ